MRISRLSKMKNYRVFRDFTWPNNLHAFAQFNVIYGWNGSGKTTLSSLLAHLQDKREISESEGEVNFELDGKDRFSGRDIPSVNIPPIRVFNRNFIAKTIEAINEGNVKSIYFLGEESIKQQKQVEKLKKELATANESLLKADKDMREFERKLDSLCKDRAKSIKKMLRGSDLYANYNKKNFKETIVDLKSKLPQPEALSDEQAEILQRQKGQQAKLPIQSISISVPDVKLLHSQTSELLNQSIVSQVIDELRKDSAVGSWVQQGLSLHKGERETGICRFCGNELSSHRRAELEAHFNDAFMSFQKKIEQTITSIENQQKSLSDLTFPDEARFYDNLVNEAHQAIEFAKQKIDSIDQVLSQFSDILKTKKEAPFSLLTLEVSAIITTSIAEKLSDAINAVNVIISKHAKTTGSLNDKIKEAYQRLEKNYVLEALPSFEKLTNADKKAKKDLGTAQEECKRLKTQIRDIERKIIEHRRPAEELNEELQAYLGHGELKFEIKDTGYALLRSGQTAKDLSEGERTAMAFLYFLKSLEDKDFDITKGVVVIDDPVSSLDANALFSAFGYMKERTKKCQQLFILTHNFAFFRQVKRWFHGLKGQGNSNIDERPARFYMLLTTIFDDNRNAVLSSIDPLLEKFDSEYHFLFKKVYEVARSHSSDSRLEKFYGMPNIARRLMETFLAYRFPDCRGSLTKRFERIEFNSEKKCRILRLLNTYSHSSGISDPEHDPSVLSETKEVMDIILELMKTVDRDHHQGMVNLCNRLDTGDC